MTASIPTETYTVLQAFRYVSGRGTVSAGFYVADSAGAIVSGPYTSEGQACDKAYSLDAEAAGVAL